MISMRRRTILFLVVVAGALGAFAGGWGALASGWNNRAASDEQPAPPSQLRSPATEPGRLVQAALPLTAGSFAQVAETVGPAVVNINTVTAREGGGRTPVEEFFGEEFFRRFFGDVPERIPQRSLGSGVIIDPSGVALTNAHVVEKATEIEVITLDGSKHKAKVIGIDKKTDLAVLKLDDGK